MKAFRKLVLLLALGLMLNNSARGTAIFTIGNNPQPGEENVLLNNGTTGSTVTGTTQVSGLAVDFSSTTQTLTEPLSGQARIEATNGTNQVPLMDVSFNLANGGTFEDAIFNMFLVMGADTASITAVTNDGSFNFVMVVGPGSNFLTITTAGGELLQSVSISAATGFTDLRQIAISGATAGTASGVPEPGATLPLLAATMVAAALVRVVKPARLCPQAA